MNKNHNFNTISPSAKSLLLLKGHTDIPFARQMAELIESPHKYSPDFAKRDISFWSSILHFEKRYKSIDQLLQDLPVKNVLELSSGYSLRGLEASERKGIHYIDTDLSDVITMKKNIIDGLQINHSGSKGRLELLPLNALDNKEFIEVVSHFPKGEIVIVNEGLLMYLDMSEKEKLCNTIHEVLRKHGGYWITADIYVKRQSKYSDLELTNNTNTFFEEHRVRDNLFESFEDAQNFLNKMGFIVDKEADVERSALSSLKHLLKSTSIEQLYKLQKAPKLQKTWRLRIADNP
jgi:O-methyltransferase involved in polyketide biosynthesis